MAYCAYVVKVEHLREHPNANKMLLLDIFGTTTCVDLSTKIGDLGVYFPVDGQLSDEFCRANDLVRRKDENGNKCGGYLDPDKRDIKAISLRQQKSDGLYLPLNCLSPFGDITQLNMGDTITEFNGHPICEKYIPRGKHSAGVPHEGNRTRKRNVPLAPLFKEHADTEQLAYNLADFHTGDLVEITLKVHGTSQRTGYLPVFQGYKRTLWDKIRRHLGTPIYDWGYVTGTRRTVLGATAGDGFYGSNEFREVFSKYFEDKLHKYETIYYEIAGYTDSSQSIMPIADNKKTNDKNFIKQYGLTTAFAYGCIPNGIQTPVYQPNAQARMFVYRMTCTGPDGDIVEYPPDYMRYRCEQMGVECVPVLWQGIIPPPTDWPSDIQSAGEYIQKIAEQYYDGADPIGKTHVREGVVCRIINRPKFCAYKHKNFSFKVLEGIVKNDAIEPDMEEIQEI